MFLHRAGSVFRPATIRAGAIFPVVRPGFRDADRVRSSGGTIAIIIGKDSGKADGGAGSQLKYRKQPHAK